MCLRARVCACSSARSNALGACEHVPDCVPQHVCRGVACVRAPYVQVRQSLLQLLLHLRGVELVQRLLLCAVRRASTLCTGSGR